MWNTQIAETSPKVKIAQLVSRETIEGGGRKAESGRPDAVGESVLALRPQPSALRFPHSNGLKTSPLSSLG